MQVFPVTESRLDRAGLPSGAPAPIFEVHSLDLRCISSRQFLGSMFLLVFSDPHCEPCNFLLPKLVSLSRRAPQVQILVVSRGESETNSNKFRECPDSFCIALQNHWEVSASFHIFLTPSAFLIDADGVIAAQPAVGPEPVLNLFRAAAIKNILLDV